MIDLAFLTWTQQWEFWVISRLLRPLEFGNLWRWDFLLVPDQVWLGVGVYRIARQLFGGTGPVMERIASMTQFVRSDPILFVAFGLLFLAEPHLVRLRARIRRVNNGEDIVQEVEAIDEGDIDDILLEEFEPAQDNTLDLELAARIEEAQKDNEVVLPASVLKPCRRCHRADAVATNIIVKCGHFAFCTDCVEQSDNHCPVCDSKGVKATKVSLSSYQPFSLGLTSKDLAKPPASINLAEGVNIARSCAVCQEREGLLTLMPCGHMLFCGPCVLGFRRCPFCTNRIIRAVRGFDVRHNEIVHPT